MGDLILHSLVTSVLCLYDKDHTRSSPKAVSYRTHLNGRSQLNFGKKFRYSHALSVIVHKE
ncbi:rCG63407 [Rattus norvegicus]|uniref:RCG63407 n=1 Tax=Rattus norvegicus TaxID=10116 RepID=A6II48_RAT|nr:rCG63407 [Rattus norvegicus]